MYCHKPTRPTKSLFQKLIFLWEQEILRLCRCIFERLYPLIIFLFICNRKLNLYAIFINFITSKFNILESRMVYFWSFIFVMGLVFWFPCPHWFKLFIIYYPNSNVYLKLEAFLFALQPHPARTRKLKIGRTLHRQMILFVFVGFGYMKIRVRYERSNKIMIIRSIMWNKYYSSLYKATFEIYVLDDDIRRLLEGIIASFSLSLIESRNKIRIHSTKW